MTARPDDTPASAVQAGLAHHRAGRLREAEAAYRRALEADPENADAWHLLGVAAHQAGDYAAAAAHAAKAITARPGVAAYHDTLGAALQRLGRIDEAVAAHRRAVAADPGSAQAQTNLGIALAAGGDLDAAVAAFERAIAADPGYLNAYQNLGNALIALDRPGNAVDVYRRSLAHSPDVAVTHYNLGNALFDLGDREAAIAAYRRAIELAPDLAQAHLNLGLALHELGRLAEAHAAYGRALELDPEAAEAHYNLGNLLQDEHRYEAAVAAYRRALEHDPNLVKAHNNLGETLQAQGRIDAALACFRRALELKPGHAGAHSNLLLCLHYHTDTEPDALFAEHRRWAAAHERPLRAAAGHDNDPTPDRRLKAGFVSPNFRAHPVGFLLEPALAHLDRARFEVVLYADVAAADEMTARLQALADGWIETRGLDDAELADRVRGDGIDVLVELTGHQGGHRLRAVARRPAPVQVAWMGGENTRGMAALDYLVTDRFHAPPGDAARYTETPVRMPHGYACYRPPDYAPAVGEPPALSRGFVTFGCFNNWAKVNARVLAVWAAILRAVPDSRLFVKTPALDDEATRARLAKALAAEGIGRERIVCEGQSPHPGLLAAYAAVDVALDPFPYSGGLTTCEALWMGVPVVTLTGKFPQGRHSTSHLSNVGLGELVAATPDDYARLAIAWATDREALARLRAGLRERVAASALCDGAGFGAAFGDALGAMWRDWCARRRGRR